MPVRSKIGKKLEALLEQHTKLFRDAFNEAIRDLKDNVSLAAMVAALEAGNIDAALAAANIHPAAFGPLADAQQAAYNAAGAATAANTPPILNQATGGAFAVRFDRNADFAQDWLRQESSRMITRITNDQREAVKTALQENLAEGRNPRTTALDIVGRIDPATKARSGGILGLTSGQEKYVRNARRELQGSAAERREYLSRKARDKRFDGAILRSIRDDVPLRPTQIDAAVLQYENKLLKLRGDTIARTETLSSIHAAEQQTLRQTLLTTGLREETVRRVWRTASDERVRDSHADMEGQTVGLDEPFVTGAGVELMYPGDPSGPPEEIINCRCIAEFRIDYLSNIGEEGDDE